MQLLDTNVISELRKAKSPRTDPAFRAWAAGADPSEFCLSSLTILELELGILQREREDREQARHLRNWMREYVLPTFRGQTFDFDTPAALATAKLHVPKTASYRDSMIAGIALVHDFTVVTRNESDFEGFGVRVLNPWKVVA